MSELRRTVESFGFIEVETPVLQVCGYFHLSLVVAVIFDKNINLKFEIWDFSIKLLDY